jgi:D-beta-D-heptose 7-phosphate kinase/D-beta-D-heptose 1-phosphate adenosyltransferase
MITNFDKLSTSNRIVLTSGGFDPIHPGHIALIQESVNFANLFARRPKLVVLVNNDEFLKNKKGTPFMPEQDRLIVVDAIEGVDYTVLYGSEDNTITNAILKLKPWFLMKGGDRSTPGTMPPSELDAANAVSCRIIYGVGGANKLASSSDYLMSFKDAVLKGDFKW